MPAAATGNPFADLSRRLVADGFAPQRIQTLYAVPEAVFEPEGVSLFFVHSEARLNYAQFAAPAAIARAKDYMSRHHLALAATEAAYGVAPEVITGIILVETRLGTYTGERRVFNTLSTMAALADPLVRERFWKQIPAQRRITAQRFAAKADAKSAWAYGELKAFLRYTAREGLDPLAVAGSYAGAIGICQFMPSNALNLAVDGDGDGRVDLFDHSDAIASVANYLRHHNWRAGLSRDQRYRVILRYNYSKPYAETVLTIADRLGG
jgi:membrane-bound lytic murein transglycosylase B